VTGADGVWFDEAAGPLVRPYAMTRGRTSSGQNHLEMITLIVSNGPLSHSDSQALQPECLQILSLAQHPVSVAEVSAQLGLPLSVTKILIGDLIDQQMLTFRSAVTPNAQILQAVINGIRRL
jgi:hypothetical protein